MRHFIQRPGIPACLVIGILCLLTASVAAAQDMGGWEAESAYNRHYNAAELDRIRVDVVKLTTLEPLPGMSPATAAIVRESDSDEDIIVHIGPEWFIKPEATGLKRGDRLKIRGCWAEIDGQDVFMAAKIKKGDFFSLKVRLTKDGTPFWTMSAEQLEKERDSD